MKPSSSRIHCYRWPYWRHRPARLVRWSSNWSGKHKRPPRSAPHARIQPRSKRLRKKRINWFPLFSIPALTASSFVRHRNQRLCSTGVNSELTFIDVCFPVGPAHRTPAYILNEKKVGYLLKWQKGLTSQDWGQTHFASAVESVSQIE